jgi:hypothetical protein
MGKGDVILNTVVDRKPRKLHLDKVLYYPDIKANLLCSSGIIEKDRNCASN